MAAMRRTGLSTRARRDGTFWTNPRLNRAALLVLAAKGCIYGRPPSPQVVSGRLRAFCSFWLTHNSTFFTTQHMKFSRILPLLVVPAILAACGQHGAEAAKDASAPVAASAPAAEASAPKETPVPAPAAEASAPAQEAAPAQAPASAAK